MIIIGTADDKAKLMFDMNDLNGNGSLTREEFKAMLKSVVISVVICAFSHVFN